MSGYPQTKFKLCSRIKNLSLCGRQAAFYYISNKRKIYVCETCRTKVEKHSKTPPEFKIIEGDKIGQDIK